MRELIDAVRLTEARELVRKGTDLKPTKKYQLRSKVADPDQTTAMSVSGARKAGAIAAANPTGAAALHRSVMDKVDWDKVGGFFDEPEPREPGTDLTAPPGNELIEPGSIPIDITWHKVKNLPVYHLMRMFFAPLFQHLMNTDVGNVEVASTLDTSLEDMKQLMGAVEANGVRDDDFSLEAFDIDPQLYHVDQAYVYAGHDGRTYLVMRENVLGHQNYYVYRSPDGRGTQLGGGHAPKQLRETRAGLNRVLVLAGLREAEGASYDPLDEAVEELAYQLKPGDTAATIGAAIAEEFDVDGKALMHAFEGKYGSGEAFLERKGREGQIDN